MIALIQLSELKEWIPWIIAGANAIASILWGVNFQRSSDRLSAAKDAHINRLESEIKSLERLSPPVLKDWLEASQDMAKAQVDGKEREITTLKEQIQALSDDGVSRTQLIERLEKLTADLELEQKGLETKFPVDQIQFEPSVRNWIIRNTEDMVNGKITPEKLSEVTGMPIPQARGLLTALQSNARYLKVMNSI